MPCQRNLWPDQPDLLQLPFTGWTCPVIIKTGRSCCDVGRMFRLSCRYQLERNRFYGSHIHNRQLRKLPQRHPGDRKNTGSRLLRRPVRRLSQYYSLVTSCFRSHQHCRQLRWVPQRRHCDRQAPDTHNKRQHLRQLPQHGRLVAGELRSREYSR